jgi:dCMP deaminase
MAEHQHYWDEDLELSLQKHEQRISIDRLSWDSYFKEIVQVTAKRSPCVRLHVGCLFVKDNRIISQGYNGYLPGCEHRAILREGHEQATVHAEQNAISDCAKRGVSCNGCTAYITHYPCIICCRILLAAGIKHIKYIHDYRNDELVEYFAKNMNVSVEKI